MSDKPATFLGKDEYIGVHYITYIQPGSFENHDIMRIYFDRFGNIEYLKCYDFTVRLTGHHIDPLIAVLQEFKKRTLSRRGGSA